MRALLTNFGTTGDIQPFLALAVELQRNGHQPILAFPEHFAARVTRLKLDFVPIGPDVLNAQRDILTATLTPAYSVGEWRALFAPLVAALPQMYEELRAVSRQADVLVSGPVQPAARMVHEVTGIPFVSVQVAHYGGGGLPAERMAVASLINPLRARLGLPPLLNPLTFDANSPQLALYATSRYVLPPPADWPAHYHMTGYFFLDDDTVEPEPELRDFVEKGSPPVVITFGSSTYDDAESLTRLIISAVRQAGCRAVIQSGWGGLAEGIAGDPSIYVAGYVPHDWLFPRAACVVHHGGAGTAASTIRAAVPSIFVTHAGGQPLRAQIARELGCAGPQLHFSQLTAQGLADALVHTLNTPAYYHAAAALGEKVRAENGVGNARTLIEKLLLELD